MRGSQDEESSENGMFGFLSSRVFRIDRILPPRETLSLMGADGWWQKINPNNELEQTFESVRRDLRILEAMTPIELASNNQKVFSMQAMKLIAEKANVSLHDVKNVGLESSHDVP